MHATPAEAIRERDRNFRLFFLDAAWAYLPSHHFLILVSRIYCSAKLCHPHSVFGYGGVVKGEATAVLVAGLFALNRSLS